MARGRVIGLFVTLLLATGLLADEPRAVRVDPARSGNYLVADLEFENLFPRPIENTLKSGLPVVIDCVIELQGDGGGHRGILLRSELSYDVWDGIYGLRRGEFSAIFEDFLALRSACDRLEALPLAPLSAVPPQATFHLRLRVSVNPFAGEEEDRVARWLAETVSDPRDPSRREFRVDLGGLIDGFFRNVDRDRNWGQSTRFGPFRMEDLRVVEAQSALEGEQP